MYDKQATHLPPSLLYWSWSSGAEQQEAADCPDCSCSLVFEGFVHFYPPHLASNPFLLRYLHGNVLCIASQHSAILHWTVDMNVLKNHV